MLAALKNGLRWGFLKVVSGEAGPWSLPGEGPSELPQACSGTQQDAAGRSGTVSPPGWTWLEQCVQKTLLPERGFDTFQGQH